MKDEESQTQELLCKRYHLFVILKIPAGEVCYVFPEVATVTGFLLMFPES